MGEEKRASVKCNNCDDGCEAEKYCDGCGEVLCIECWDEHNMDTPCHLAGPEQEVSS